jgi:hypothetical protein
VIKQLEGIEERRPYFTYYMSFCQIVVLAAAIGVYGFAPIAFTSNSLFNF